MCHFFIGNVLDSAFDEMFLAFNVEQRPALRGRILLYVARFKRRSNSSKFQGVCCR